MNQNRKNITRDFFLNIPLYPKSFTLTEYLSSEDDTHYNPEAFGKKVYKVDEYIPDGSISLYILSEWVLKNSIKFKGDPYEYIGNNYYDSDEMFVGDVFFQIYFSLCDWGSEYSVSYEKPDIENYKYFYNENLHIGDNLGRDVYHSELYNLYDVREIIENMIEEKIPNYKELVNGVKFGMRDNQLVYEIF